MLAFPTSVSEHSSFSRIFSSFFFLLLVSSSDVSWSLSTAFSAWAYAFVRGPRMLCTFCWIFFSSLSNMTAAAEAEEPLFFLLWALSRRASHSSSRAGTGRIFAGSGLSFIIESSTVLVDVYDVKHSLTYLLWLLERAHTFFSSSVVGLNLFLGGAFALEGEGVSDCARDFLLLLERDLERDEDDSLLRFRFLGLSLWGDRERLTSWSSGWRLSSRSYLSVE